jgi:hypothetical protein
MTEQARARLAARARMISRIRRGVIVAMLAAFVLAWGVIAATGSMGSATAATPAATTPGSASSSSPAAGDSSATSGDSSSSFGGTTSPDGGSGAVTTGQS